MALRTNFKDWELKPGAKRTYSISNLTAGTVFDATITETTVDEDAYVDPEADTFSAMVFNETNAQVNRNTMNERTVTLAASGWNGNTQTVPVYGLTADSLVFVSAAPNSVTDYGEAGVYCSAQGSETLTFRCSDTPSVNIDVNVAFSGVS